MRRYILVSCALVAACSSTSENPTNDTPDSSTIVDASRVDAPVNPPVDAGADVTQEKDAAATDAGSDAPTGPMFTIERADDATPSAGASITAGQRARARLRWNIPGGKDVSLDGAGDLVAVVTDGAPKLDDLSAVAGTAVTSATVAATLPFSTTILGDTWQNRISISPRGVITRGAPSGSTILDPVLPIPVRTGIPPADWADGTLAAFLDTRLSSAAGNTGKIRTLAIGSTTDADQRFVIEWANVTTGVDYDPRIETSMTFQAAIYRDGRVEYRIKPGTVPATSANPNGDGAILRGQGATIGIANAAGTAIVPVSIHRAAIPTAGVTYTFYPKGKLPASGQAIVTLPTTTGAQTFTLKATGEPDRTVTATVNPMYVMTSDTKALKDIRTTGTAIAFGTSNIAALDLPFAVDVFHEGWRSLAVSRSAAVGPWGLSAGAMTAGYNYDANPLPKRVSPNGYVAAFYPMNGGSGWCTGATAPAAAYSLVEGTAPSRTVTILWSGIQKCGASVTDKLDVEIVLHENGNVELLYGALSSTADALTGKGVAAALENGAGDLAFTAVKDTAGVITDNKRFVFTREK